MALPSSPPRGACPAVAQHACIIDVELIEMGAQIANATRETCWPKCKFTKARPPEVPAQCWNDSAAFDVPAARAPRDLGASSP